MVAPWRPDWGPSGPPGPPPPLPCTMLRRVTLLGLTAIILVLLFVRVPDTGPTPVLIHPTTDRLRFRSGVPDKFTDHNVIRTVGKREAFRVLSQSYGISESLIAARWFYVENIATGERGWVASWYSEELSSPPLVRRALATVLFSQAVAGYRDLATVSTKAEFVFAVAAVSLLGFVVTVLSFFLQLRKRFGRATETAMSARVTEQGVHKPTPSAPVSQLCFYGTAGGSAWSMLRKRASC